MSPEIRVERCPSCGAPYNVTRLDAGARFTCRRCQAVVHVAVDPPVTSSPSRGALAAAAALLLCALATRALPWPPPLDADVVLLGATALAGVLLLVRPSPSAFVVTGGLLLLLFLRAEGPESSVALGAPEPGIALARIALGAGCFALASRRAGSRGAARTLVFGGALGLLASQATTAAVASDAVAEVATRARAVATWWTDVVWSGGDQPPGTSPWSREIPWALAGVAALLGTLAALLPGRRAGPVSRFLARVGFASLLLGLLVPSLYDAWGRRDDLLGVEGWRTARSTAADLLLRQGFATWFAGAVLVAHAAWAHGARPATPPSRPPFGGWHVTVALLAAGALLLLENPATGVVAAQWPWEVLARPGFDRAAGFAVLLGGLALASLSFALAPVLRRGGALPAMVAGLGMMAVDTGVPEHGVPRAALPVLAAVAAGVVWPRRGLRWGGPGRAAAALCAGVILAILLWPRAGTEIALAGHAGPWDCALLRWVAALPDAMRGGDLGWAFLAPGSVVVPVTALSAVVALFAAVTSPVRLLAWLGATLAFVAAVYPAGHAFAQALRDAAATDGAALEAAARATAETLRLLPGPAVIAVLAASADVSGGARGESGGVRIEG